MLTLNLNLDQHGNAVLRHEDRLRDLGLIVRKEEFGTLVPVGSGGVFSLFKLTFERSDLKFSAELVEFLQGELEFTTANIEKLEQQATYLN